MKLIDSRGETCPIPVIMLKKALKQKSSENIRQIVDNEIAKQNIEKMLSELNIEFSSKQENGDYIIDLKLVESDVALEEIIEKTGDIIIFDSDKMGKGSDELGKALMNSFIYTLTESDKLPSKIIMYNSGVKLACENDDTILDFEKLEKSGVEILSCGLCLDYFGLEKSLKVGSVTNMYSILQSKLNATKIIKP